MPQSKKPFHEYESVWPSEVITRLQSTYPAQIETSRQHVSLLIQEEERPYWPNLYKVVGAFKSSFVANRLALDLFRQEYGQFLRGGDNENIIEKPSPDENQVAWQVSETGELSLRALDGAVGDKYNVYVKREVIHTAYDSSIVEPPEPEYKEWGEE